MKFAKEFLREFEGETVEDKIIEHSRWSVRHTRIFIYDGRFYKTHYSVGATESQDESPYEYDDEEIECPEVQPKTAQITVYEELCSPPTSA